MNILFQDLTPKQLLSLFMKKMQELFHNSKSKEIIHLMKLNKLYNYEKYFMTIVETLLSDVCKDDDDIKNIYGVQNNCVEFFTRKPKYISGEIYIKNPSLRQILTRYINLFEHEINLLNNNNQAVDIINYYISSYKEHLQYLPENNIKIDCTYDKQSVQCMCMCRVIIELSVNDLEEVFISSKSINYEELQQHKDKYIEINIYSTKCDKIKNYYIKKTKLPALNLIYNHICFTMNGEKKIVYMKKNTRYNDMYCRNVPEIKNGTFRNNLYICRN